MEEIIKEILYREFDKLIKENLKPFNVNINKIANSSDLIRERYKLITGKSWR